MESKRPIVIVSGGLIALSAVGIVFVLASGVLFGDASSSTSTPAPVAAGSEAASASETTSVKTPQGRADTQPAEPRDKPDPVAAVEQPSEVDDEPVHYKTEIEERAAKSPVSKASKTLQPSWHMVRKQLGDLGDAEAKSAVTQVIEDLKLLMRDPDALDPQDVAETQDALLAQLKERYAPARTQSWPRPLSSSPSVVADFGSKAAAGYGALLGACSLEGLAPPAVPLPSSGVPA